MWLVRLIRLAARHQSFLGRPGTSTTAVSRDNKVTRPAHYDGFPCVILPSEMPTGVVSQQRKRAAAKANRTADDNNNDVITDNPLSQLQQAVELSAGPSTGDPLHNPGLTPGQAIDGARNPIAPGAEYTSLRRITRRLPDDPEGVLDGVDTTHADLSWTAREDGDDINPSTGEPWLFPKKRGRKVGSNLEDFKEEIEERTKNGQGCKAISEALVAKGVDTSSRAVARQRMKWGLRQRVSCLVPDVLLTP